jgi:hypothetical protein
VYAWIWRRLPFGLPGKIIGSLAMLSLLGAMLWFWAFPAAEPLLPFDDVNVTDQNGPGGSNGRPRVVNPSESVPPDDVIPYSTDENQPDPSPPKQSPKGSPKKSPGR